MEVTLESTPSEMLSIMKQTFFTGEALSRVLVYMSNECAVDVHDPITRILAMFINVPLNLCLTKVGLVPFRDEKMAVFPYTEMTSKEKKILSKICAVMEEKDFGFVSTQMGGGAAITLTSNNLPRIYADTVEVVSSFCQCILSDSSNMQIDHRIGLCNVTLQRLHTVVNICRDDMTKININAKSLIEKLRQSKKSPVEINSVYK